MRAVIAIYDACVLYPAPLRDLLLHLALADLVRARWSAAIHDEWIRSVLEDRPDLSAAQLRRTRTLMDAHVHDALVEGFESLIASLDLPDRHDRHVLAAAIHAKAEIIVTYNVNDFPAAALQPFSIAAEHPDDFIAGLLEAAPERVASGGTPSASELASPADVGRGLSGPAGASEASAHSPPASHDGRATVSSGDFPPRES